MRAGARKHLEELFIKSKYIEKYIYKKRNNVLIIGYRRKCKEEKNNMKII